MDETKLRVSPQYMKDRKMKHKHKWNKTTRIMKRTRDSDWIERLFMPYYNANISECKCGEWYFSI